MDSKTYIANAIRTESVPAKLEINQVALHAMMEIMIQASKVADLVKRKLFYGADMDPKAVLDACAALNGLSQYVGVSAQHSYLNDTLTPETLAIALDQAPEEVRGTKLENLNIRLLHAGLGLFSESGELIEALQKQYVTGVMDVVNFGEEIGDQEWYQAIGFDETGISEAHCREKNIAKLRKRFPDKFDAVAAVTRDLVAERAILEAPAAALKAAFARHDAAIADGSLKSDPNDFVDFVKSAS